MERKFYDCDVQTGRSSGNDSVQAVADRAERLGFTGVVIADYITDEEAAVSAADAIDTVDTGLDIRVGAKLRPEDPGELKQQLRAVRDHVDVVVVHGGDVTVNKAACGDTRVDVLAHPELRRKDAGLDHVAVKTAAENRVAVGISIRPLLETYGKVRAHILSHLRQNVRLCQKFGTPVVTVSSANKVEYLRAPRELAAFPQMLGMDVGDSFATVSDTPRQILRRAEQARDEDVVQPGVEVDRQGDDDE